MNTVQKFKLRRIVKALLGTLLKKGWDWFKNSTQTAAIAESPAVMTASGWRVDRNGKAKLDLLNTKEVKLLRNNLATIGEAGVTAPTLVGDIGALYNAVRHPVLTGKTIWKTGLDALWFLKNLRASKVYHGTPNKEFTNLNLARTASENNIGIHVTPRKEIAESFVRFRGGNDGHILEGYIPRHNMETIDIGANDYRLFSNSWTRRRTLGQYSASTHKVGITTYYDTHPEAILERSLYKKYGGNPSVSESGRGLMLDNDVTIPLQKETWPNMPTEARLQMDKILKEGSSSELKNGETYQSRALRLNLLAAKIASDNGKKVIKYINTNPSEGGGGVSYMVTDPSVFYNPLKYNWQQIMNRTKYPVMYGTNQ